MEKSIIRSSERGTGSVLGISLGSILLLPAFISHVIASILSLNGLKISGVVLWFATYYGVPFSNVINMISLSLWYSAVTSSGVVSPGR